MNYNIKLKNAPDKSVLLDEKGYEAISSDKHLSDIKFMKNLRLNAQGYAIYMHGKSIGNNKHIFETILIQRWLAAKFMPEAQQGLKFHVYFINGNRLDCRLGNLECATIGNKNPGVHLKKIKRNKNIVKELTAGENLNELAEIYDLSIETIRNIAIRSGIDKKFLKQKNKQFEKRNKEIIEQLMSGKTVKELSGIYKLDDERIRQIAKKAGIDYKKRHKQLRYEAELPKLIAKAKEINRQLTIPIFYELGITYPPLIKYYQQELEKLGFKKINTKKGNRFTNEEMLEDLKALAHQSGKTPGIKDIIRHCRHSYATYRKYFGTLINAQRAAGLIPNKRGGHNKGLRKYTQEQLLAYLKELATRKNRTPNSKDIKEDGKISLGTLIRYFGSTTQARIQAGLKPRYRSKQDKLKQ